MERLIVDVISNPIVFYSVLFILVFSIVVIFLKLNSNKKSSLNNIDDVKLIDYKKEQEEDEKTDESKIELESLLSKMNQDLEKGSVSSDPDEFEKKQEESSIISYTELLKAKEEGKIDIVDDEEIEKEIYDEVENQDKQAEDEEIKEEKKEIEDLIPNPFEKAKEDYKKFKNTDVISPIFGYGSSDQLYENMIKKEKQKEVKEEKEAKGAFSDDELAEIIEFEPSDFENPNEQFLKKLKEFRKNLE